MKLGHTCPFKGYRDVIFKNYLPLACMACFILFPSSVSRLSKNGHHDKQSKVTRN